MIQSKEFDGQGSKKPPALGAIHKPPTPGPTGTTVHPHQCIKSAANKTPSAQGKPAINLTGGNHHQSILQLLLFNSKFSINCSQPKVPPAPDSARAAELIHHSCPPTSVGDGAPAG
ncbi:hypothetical protein Nepgr_014683 [Nepenthes gracilis]|uniref:Uncharacterized protein n=1 Tax=Nepenthes gracilis TaxID=150966 RepID=A0AAD3SLR9_NEPGR|nr:hypothetical protein Nepgr_014683 [Nepenthes gracilis]